MRTTSLFAIALSLVCATGLSAQTGRGGGGQPAALTQTIDARTTGVQKIDGYLPLYWDDKTGSPWVGINKFDTELLYSPRLTAGGGAQRNPAPPRQGRAGGGG